jgi:hypothetical protein
VSIYRASQLAKNKDIIENWGNGDILGRARRARFGAFCDSVAIFGISK